MTGLAIKPQAGPQTEFLSSSADIVIYGGQAFGGKTYSLLLEPLRHIHRKGFTCVIFRRTYTEICAPGSCWEEASNIYPLMGGKPVIGSLEWRFPAGSVVRFAHLQFEEDRLRWNGAQIALIEFDQLESFTKSQFLFLFKANRTSCGINAYMRATCNPDCNSFLRTMLDWWIDEDSGLPIKERSGVLRYFKVVSDEFIWSDEPKPGYQSFTFIPASRYDNLLGMAANPGYEARLEALPLVDRMQQREGNWREPPASGSYFQKGWFEVIPTAPLNLTTIIRYWDRAGTEPNEKNNDPDWTVGTLVGWDSRGYTYILDSVRTRSTPGKVVDLIKNTASQDGTGVIIGLEQEPGASGKSEAQTLVRELKGYNVRAVPKTVDKETAAKPLSAQAEAGNVKIVKGGWNQWWLLEMEGFPNGSHDDVTDSSSGAYNMHVSPKVRWLPPPKDRPKQEKPRDEGVNFVPAPFYPVQNQRKRY